MDKSFLQLEYSGWWVLLIIIIAAGLSYFLYAKKNIPWNQTQNWTLASFRFLGIAAILLLLLSPSIRTVTNTVDPPSIAIALDNSQSVVARGLDQSQVLEQISVLEQELKNDGIEASILTFNDSTSFNASTSNLSNLLDKAIEKMEKRLEN